MRWQGRRKSKNVIDSRGQGGGGMAMGGGAAGILILLVRMIFSRFGIGGIVVLVIGFFALQAMGFNTMALLTGGQQTAQVDGRGGARGTGDICETGGETYQFICFVLGSTEDVWNAQFHERGSAYKEPKLEFFSGGVQAGACGYASSAVGPFYCPATQRVYLDISFFDELAGRFNASGDFAQAYVVAHEVGHHIQTITGTSRQVQAAKQGRSQPEQNALQVQMELQADCLAGVWAYHENRLVPLEDGDIEEALTAAKAIGDDTLQRQAGRKPMPDSFTHGTSDQRMRWFKTGYRTGRMESCDTFNAARL